MNICDSFPFDQFCVCKSPKGKNLNSYRQFNNSKKKFKCCYNLQVSPGELFNYEVLQGNTPEIINSVTEYLTKINNSGLSECDYSEFYKVFDTYIINNFPELYKSSNNQRLIYNNFYVGKTSPVPDVSETQISCLSSSDTPYVLSYVENIDTFVYNKNLFFCSEINNNLFPEIEIQNGVLMDYSVNRFYYLGKPCIGNTCQIPYNNNPNASVFGGKDSVYRNEGNSRTGLIVGYAILVFISFFCGFMFLKGYSYLEKERNRIRLI